MAGSTDLPSDHISSLPDGVLHEILARLPLDDAVRTAALSLRWRHLWSTNPVLHFPRWSRLTNKTRLPFDAYAPAVDRCLRLCSAAEKLRSLSFDLDEWPDLPAIFDRWARFAASRTVENVSVSGSRSSFFGGAEVPLSLFRCHSLRSLHLDLCFVPHIPSCVGVAAFAFPLLTSLSLHQVNITDGCLSALLSACPRLEKLVLYHCEYLDRIAVSSPSLKTLKVHTYSGRVTLECTPRLRCFGIHCHLSNLASLEAAAELDDAILFSWLDRPFTNRQQWRSFVSGIAHVKTLFADHWFLQFITGQDLDFGRRPPVFKNLEELHFFGEPFSSTSLYALVANLQDCPSLEKLSIHRNYSWSGAFYGKYESWGSAPDEHVLLDHDDPLEEFEGIGIALPRLKSMTIAGFSGETEEMRLVEFALDKATSLQSVIVYHVKEITEKTLDVLSERMLSFHRASSLAQLSFIELPCRHECPTNEWWKHRAMGR